VTAHIRERKREREGQATRTGKNDATRKPARGAKGGKAKEEKRGTNQPAEDALLSRILLHMTRALQTGRDHNAKKPTHGEKQKQEAQQPATRENPQQTSEEEGNPAILHCLRALFDRTI
jgi:hypothetical protein